ncbi:hypothetical protein KFU94_61265 [Chloroflexi bacterium TSY]|nr:hypothetical protein [Chloroflexi bacterium TSY]
MIGKSDLVDWRPFSLNGQPRESYGTETGYVLANRRKQLMMLTRLYHKARRDLRFQIYPKIKKLWHDA